MLATSLARDLYRDWYGEEPPPVLPWRIDAIPHTGDPTLALYTVDRDAWRVTLNLHEGQMRAWESDSLYTFMLAGAQGGKTAFLPWVLARKILADMAAGSDGGDYLIATSTSQLFNSGFRPVILEVFEYVLGIARMWPSTDFFELRDPTTGEFWAHGAKDRMWGRILLRAAASRGALEGFTAKAAILDECGQDAFTMYAWDAVERRLDVHKGPIWAGTTLYNFGWLKQLIFDPWEDGKLPHVDVIQFPSVMNPAYSLERYEQKRAVNAVAPLQDAARGQVRAPVRRDIHGLHKRAAQRGRPSCAAFQAADGMGVLPGRRPRHNQRLPLVGGARRG